MLDNRRLIKHDRQSIIPITVNRTDCVFTPVGSWEAAATRFLTVSFIYSGSGLRAWGMADSQGTPTWQKPQP